MLVGGLLLLHTCLLAWADTRHSPTIDEVGHLPAGLSHWQLGRFEMYRVNPHLVRTVATIPVMFARPETDWGLLHEEGYHKQLEFDIGKQFIVANGDCSFEYFTLARWACIPFSLLGAYVCFRWARELYGFWAGLLAMALWCFCPNILGNAQLITPDTGAAALGATAAYSFWRWLRSPGWSRAALAGASLGLAELTKTSWIVLFPLWPALWGVWRLSRRGDQGGLPWPGEAAQLGLVLLLGLYLINLGYGFDGSFEPLGNYDFVSESLAGPKYPPPQQRNRFEGSLLGAVPVPLPRDYVLGIDEQKRDFEQPTRSSYLRGEWRQGGWWYFYLYGLGIKTPLGTLAVALLAGALTVARRGSSLGWRDDLVVLAPAAIVLVLVSSQTGFNRHLRYVLPALPFVFIWASKVAGITAPRGVGFRTLVLGAVVWSVVSSLRVYPHSLSYFNALGGGPEGGHAHLVNSSIDWGQDLLYLKRWLDDHPEARPLSLAYFGLVDPRVAGIEFTLPPKASSGPLPGWYAVSVTILRGYRYSLPDGRGREEYPDGPHYTYFLRLKPVAMAGYSIYIYHISPEEADRVRSEMGLPPLGGKAQGE